MAFLLVNICLPYGQFVAMILCWVLNLVVSRAGLRGGLVSGWSTVPIHSGSWWFGVSAFHSLGWLDHRLHHHVPQMDSSRFLEKCI